MAPYSNVTFQIIMSYIKIPQVVQFPDCCRLVAGVAGSNPDRNMDVCLLGLYVVLFCIGRGLCDGLITRPEESYRVSVCVIKKPQRRRPMPGLCRRAIGWME
jgi:hypothetical protein